MKGLLVVLPLCVGLLSMVANQLWWIVIGEIEIRGSFIVCDGNVVYNGLLWEGQSWDDGLWSWSGVGVELGWSLELELECGWSWRGSGGARCLIVLVGVTCFCWISWFQEPQSVTSWSCGPQPCCTRRHVVPWSTDCML